MVHRGRLSAACGPCRSRRLKCDQQKPFCSQCIRAKRECSGYRDVTAGRFYDQTEEVKKKNSSSHSSSSSPSTSFSSPPSPVWQASPPVSLVRQHVSVPMHDHGTAFMLNRYLSKDGLNEVRGPLGTFLPHILSTNSGRAVTASLNATGLAALSNIYQSPQLMIAARQEYGRALAETNAVLCDEVQSTSNASLVAVAFLGMFEIMTCNGPPLMEKYLNHVEGSARLLQLRGSDQLKDDVGLGLFSQFRTTIVLGNFWLKNSTPSWLIDLSNEALAYRGERGREDDELFLLMAKVGDLCAGLRNGALIEPIKVVKKALKLDAELSAWAMSLAPSRHYTVINLPKSADEGSRHAPFRHVYGNHYHIYPDTVIAAWWNDYRFVRMILLELICWLCDHLASKNEDLSSEYRQTIAHSSALSQQLTEDICASVPYHLGATKDSTKEDWSSTRTGGMVRLIWPLFIAADAVGVVPKTVDWIADTLFRIGCGVGVQQAVVMSNLLRSGQHLIWLPELGK
ncbi:hypothetical protein BJY04DRAFT_203372 [Aspergillus karnatakaensis]|uniref:Zn(II)2Cys6 transcription factor domain-containing protein n=1 Tax=Aspergillus karnatakaensis TaxID=1810916 RepID=UPI003CCE21BF